MNYLKAVLQKNEEQKISELKKLILLGKKLNKNITPDKKKLEILLRRAKKNNVIKTDSSKIYHIQNIKTSNNQIIITYNTKISDDFIKFFELKQPKYFRDVYDLKGSYSKAKASKLSIKNIDKIVVGQYKPYILRIVLTNKTNLKSSYKINNNQIIINTSKTSETKSTPVIKKIQKVLPKKESKKDNKFIDTKNFIRSISTEDNLIKVNFNGKFSAKKLKYSSYKHNKKYYDVFDINGIYAFAKPLKLKIDGFEKIVVTQNLKKLRIKLIDKKNYKIVYSIKKQELIIKILNLKTFVSKKTLPYANFRSRTIVIDAGHGAHDAGAVGPNKRYEKVVTLKVAKYLYAILKKRGHKVYLTRSKDTFIKVMHRTILANKKNADIFISIHANSVPRRKAHKVKGIETFFLSPARSARAKRVAAKENRTDIRKMSDSTKQAFLESLNRPRITASHKLAIDVQAGLLQSVRKNYKDVIDSGVREGPFWVLVGAQMPSILVEVGYMSHPLESKRLYSSKYQKLLANGIANGVDSYFSKNP